jgi:hypothetical protein
MKDNLAISADQERWAGGWRPRLAVGDLVDPLYAGGHADP